MTALADLDLILASTSPYRADLLRRLTANFRTEAPAVDETVLELETAPDAALRLAQRKAEVIAERHHGVVVIGSDQVATCEGATFGKPGSVVAARDQLRASSGRTVLFHTAVCVVDSRGSALRLFSAVDTTAVVFRKLLAAQIDRYLTRDQPLDCAGSFKAEAAGIALLERIDSSDPTALIGLPLIALCGLLHDAGIAVI